MTTSSDNTELQTARARWMRLVEVGDLAAALTLVDATASLAERLGDPVWIDRVRCNRAAIALELGVGGSVVAELRTLLMRSEDTENEFLAAYTIARHYELAKEVRKGLFYAQLALDRASSLNQARHAESLNQIANFQVAESRFNEALETYAEAQQHLAPGDALRHAVIGYNVGYCRVVLGSHRAGLRSIYQSLRRLRRLGAERHEMLARLDLAFALLEFGKARLAERHASRAIELASQFADPTAKKNALYLAGAAASARGDEFTARRRFAELQGDFFPEADYLPDLLLSVDVRSLVNLKA